jgi:hypothetical protein
LLSGRGPVVAAAPGRASSPAGIPANLAGKPATVVGLDAGRGDV